MIGLRTVPENEKGELLLELSTRGSARQESAFGDSKLRLQSCLGAGPLSLGMRRPNAMSRRNTIVLFLLGLFASSVAIVLFAKFGIDAIQGEPYRMTLRRVNGQSIVQFAQVDIGSVSPQFPVNLPIETQQVVDLRSEDVSIPGCVVEFCDTTMLPGRFKIRIGEVTYDVMEKGIEVAGKVFDWQRP
jgi:hypothetical protein